MEIGSDTRELVARALLEDLGPGDVTAEAVVPEDATGRATITQKAPGVLFGIDVAAEVFRQTGAGGLKPVAAESEWRDDVPAEVARAAGPARALLAAERTALNLLGHLSGVATLTARFVRAIEGSGARILDTRKTTPGLRALEKAAVAAGWRHQPPDGPVRRDPDQGEPRGDRRRGRGGGPPGSRGASRPTGRGRVPRPRGGP